MVERRYLGMTAVQGKVWNCLRDDDWLTLNEIKRRSDTDVHSHQIQFMCEKYGVIQQKINGRLFFKLPEFGQCLSSKSKSGAVESAAP